MALTNKRRAFIDEYLRTFNATAAAVAAGYSEKTAYSIGSEILRIPEVAAEIEGRLSERTMSVNEALARLTEQGRGVYTDYIDAQGHVDIAGLKAAGLSHLIKGTKETKYGVVVEFYDAQAAIDKILRAQGAYVDRHEFTGKDGAPLTIAIVNVDVDKV
jgi:phage terminase small subunit